jgi:hypothetical protein
VLANTGNGDEDQARIGNLAMAEDLTSSAQSEKTNTGKTKNLTPDQALEILQQAALNCQHAGIDVKITTLYKDGVKSVVIILGSVAINVGKLVLANS